MTEDGMEIEFSYPRELEDDCRRCDEFGLVVVCPDDVCRAAGECLHGDEGMALCPDCGGSGRI